MVINLVFNLTSHSVVCQEKNEKIDKILRKFILSVPRPPDQKCWISAVRFLWKDSCHRNPQCCFLPHTILEWGFRPDLTPLRFYQLSDLLRYLGSAV